ncbi:uncharacterized protein [Dermacentor albipictus]|uniref:uncharacterized protein isoform X1 n=1 Tax=Dermacentor albipictus TaxID=60249 RepID=UPI0038FC9EB9
MIVLFNGATIGECVYNLVQERDLPVTLKPFPTYSKVIDISTTRLFTIAYAVISAMAVGADLVLLLGVKAQPVKALRVFLYWNTFHFLADVVIITAFFVAIMKQSDATEAINASNTLIFIATAIRLSILGSVYQTYRVYVANPNYRDT